MAEMKTRPTDANVADYLAAIQPDARRTDAQGLQDLLAAATGETALMWGTSIIGYGHTRYQGSGGRSTDWFLVGFAPRKANLVLYFLTDHDPQLLADLGKFKRGVGCLYINKLADIDRAVLRSLIEQSVNKAR